MEFLNIVRMNIFFNDDLYEVDNHDVFELMKNIGVEC